MAATNLQFDCTGLTVTYGSGTPTVIALTQTVKVSLKRKNNLEPWQPGGARGATILVTASSERGINIQGGDVAKLNTIPSDTPCTITGTFPDAKNGTGTGSISFTLINAIVDDTSSDATARKFAMGGASFEAYWADGTTDPLTYVVAS